LSKIVENGFWFTKMLPGLEFQPVIIVYFSIRDRIHYHNTLLFHSRIILDSINLIFQIEIWRFAHLICSATDWC